MRHQELTWEAFCLGVDPKEYAVVGPCSESDPTQQWTQEENGSGGHRYKNVASSLCLQLDTNDDDSEAVKVGFCNDIPEAGWFEETDALPLNMLRTVVFDEPSKQRKCLSAVVQDDLPGPPPEAQDGTVCQHICQALPNVSIPFIGPLDAPLGIKMSLENFTLQLPELVGKFDTCGFYDAAPGGLVSHKGTLTLDMDIPEIPFNVPHFHFERPPAHGSGMADGSVHAVISLQLDYNLQNASLECSGFDIKIPDMKLGLHDGGGWELLLDAVTGAIKSIIKSAVPKVADPAICPIINRYAEVVDQCSDAAKDGAVAFALCVLKGPVCMTPPCYACNHELGSCAEVPINTTHSTGSIESCSNSCVAPAPPPPPCIEDGQCTDGGADHSCCTGRVNRKGLFGCKYGTCGCLDAGNCTAHKNDCCSLSAHRDLLCDALLGHRCN